MIDAMFDLFAAFYQGGDFLQAERMACSIRQAVPDDTVSLQLLGLVYYRTGRREEAVEAFDAAANHAVAGDARRHVDSSLRASRQCLRAARGHGSALTAAWYDLGLVLLRLRRYRQAVSAFQSALSARPDCRAAQRALQRSVARAGRRSDAMRARSSAVMVRGERLLLVGGERRCG